MQKQSIAVGIVLNQDQQVLICKRNTGRHLAGYWEFPGGKLESCESFKFALRRELFEEVGINTKTAIKILETQYQYSDRLLRFQFFKVKEYSGEVVVNENQEINWVNICDLSEIDFPPANRAAIDALRLPDYYMVADERVLTNKLISCVESQLNKGVRIIQHRSSLDVEKRIYLQHARDLKRLCESYDAKYICNCSLDWLGEIQPHGVHLNSRCLHEVATTRVKNSDYEYFSASCHNEKEVNLANQLEVRCVLIGPVNATESHPEVAAINWKQFNKLCAYANCPVYAIGGMKLGDQKIASIYGAQGIAAIRAFI